MDKNMEEKKIIIANKESTLARHECHNDFEYYKHLIVSKKAENQCTVAIMEIPPRKTVFPYHYHASITEVFYIISGKGRLETPDGEKQVTAGDVIVFPPGKNGAHKIWNTSDTELLIYLDCDTTSAADATFYPHSDKVGLLIDGKPDSFFVASDAVDYYKDE
ncbi:MAG: Cupin 2 conserved barrel domain protein [Oscillospiraceae bacterium]|jgi:uncharacterized cupin superfamily protein|nr:Cupin 2 conserved barrel domain protein [Oscillospiraceae bacterium]